MNSKKETERLLEKYEIITILILSDLSIEFGQRVVEVGQDCKIFEATDNEKKFLQIEYVAGVLLDEFIRLFQEKRLTRLERLDFSHSHNSLPNEIWQLPNLISLDLTSADNFTSLSSEIGQLSTLAYLSIQYSKLTNLPLEIGQLTNLTNLILYRNYQLTSLPVKIGQLTNLTYLHLDENRLNSLPAEIGQLTNLTYLSLDKNQLTSLPVEIGQLTNLTKLYISENPLPNIPTELWQLRNLVSFAFSWKQCNRFPTELFQLTRLSSLRLESSSLTDLPVEFCRLTNLESFILHSGHFACLPAEIGRLINLTFLSLYDNQLTSLPAEIGQLTNLTSLYLEGNQLTSLPAEIGQLTKLTSLELSNNQLTSLPAEIGQLTNLTSLSLNNNQLTSLPVEIINLVNLESLNLGQNKLEWPPEILDKSNNAQAIINYFVWMLGGKRKAISETKMLVVGQGNVGKTSLIKRLTMKLFDLKEFKTDGIAIAHWKIKNHSGAENQPTEIALHIWDFGGQEIMHATHQFFLTKRSLYLLVLDSRLTQEENRAEYWLKIIQSFGGESPVLIVGNKTDQHPLDIDRTGLQKKYPNIVGILETSAATGAGIEELKAAITGQVNNLPHVRDLLPEIWFTVKIKLEELGRESNFITHDKYLELCAENQVSDETSQRTLIGFLHDLGVVLYFQEERRLAELGILNPQWVTNGVYKILNSKTLFQNKGVLTVAMLDEILNLPEYPRGKRLFIVDMMKKFELCYDIESDKTFLVPDLLPKDEPAELTFNGIPAFEYAYPVLPSSFITRFIVRMNQHIDDHCVWRSGVLLKIGGNRALVKADLEDRTVRIAIDGLEHTRRDALSAIRYQLDEIHASIKGLNPEKFVPVPGAANAAPLKYEYLLMLEAKGIEMLPVQDGNRLIEIIVRQILSGVESESRRKEQAHNTYNVFNVGGNVGGHIVMGDENKVDDIDSDKENDDITQ